jgi:hypothetical protein
MKNWFDKMTHKCEDCEEEPFYAVLDTIKGEYSFLCYTDYQKRCEDQGYKDTHLHVFYDLIKDNIDALIEKANNEKLQPDDPIVVKMMASLRRDLRSAVKEEDYGAAKEIRDTIRRYEKEIKL